MNKIVTSIKKILLADRKEDFIVENYSLDCIDQIVNLLHPHKGIYIDVGSHDPRYNSSTYLLYKKGWKGVCVDPCLDYITEYKRFRPNDIFINKAIHSSKKKLSYYLYGCSGMNTTSTNRAREIKQLNHQSKQHYSTLVKRASVEATKISTIIHKYNIDSKSITLLCIDVEGSETEVLKSANLKKNRPLLIAIETLGYNLPDHMNDQVDRPKAIDYLLKHNYSPCIFLRQNIIFYDKSRKNDIEWSDYI